MQHSSQPLTDSGVRLPERKHGTVATILSVVFMGLGQVYNSQIKKGLAFAAIEVVGWLLTPYWIASIRGLMTLGAHGEHLASVGGIYKMVPGDNSIFLMIQGLIALVFLLLILVLYAVNIADARTIGRRRDRYLRLGLTNQRVGGQGHYFPYAVLGIPAILVFLFSVVPVVFMILLAFTNYSGPNHLPPHALVNWVGLDTFRGLFGDPSLAATFVGVFTWTVVWAVLATLSTFFGGLLVALLIAQQGIRLKAMWRTILIVPWAIPSFLSLLIMGNLFNSLGPIDHYLNLIGLPSVPWLTDPVWAKVSLLLVNMWLGVPVSMAFASGVLTTIPRELYEAAEVDGATMLQRFRGITLPLFLYATAPLLILSFVGNFNNFNVIFLFTGGNPAEPRYLTAGSTDILITWLYKLTVNFGANSYNLASAIGVLIFIFVVTLSLINFYRSRSFREEGMVQ